MAILYGNGDFVRTSAIAVSAGYDCDNQASTCAGLMGVIHGIDGIPDYLKYGIKPGRQWEEPFNNTYINYTRDKLPIHNKITDIVERIAGVAQQAIWENGGRKLTQNGEVVYQINTDF